VAQVDQMSGGRVELGRTLSVPATITRPRPPILIGGMGERKTLRLVARYADACNIFSGPEAAHKLDVLREHCEREGRDYDEIEKTTSLAVRGNDPDGALEHLRAMHELGFTVAYTAMVGPEPLATLERFATRVIPEISSW
jgi:alkanesulfonate monooxygenase